MKEIMVLLLMISAMIFVGTGCGDDDDDDSTGGENTDDDDDNDDNDDDDDTIPDDDDDDDNDDNDDDNDNDNDNDNDDDTDPGDPIVCTAGFSARQQEYLEYCSDHNGPGSGGIHGQLCRLAMNEETLNEEAIDNSCEKIDNREDCSDFDLNSIIRLLYLYGDHPTLTVETKQQLEYTVLNFKYWLDEPGEDDVCWWSENHQILYHTAELLAGQLYPTDNFPNSDMTGQNHVDHAIPKLNAWLDWRGQIGFVEWHSNVYFNEDIPALTNLVDFAEDEQIRTKAAMLLDIIAFDFANNYFKGIYATTHGRTYPGHFIGGQDDSTNEAAYIMLGIVDYSSSGNFSGCALATSESYCTPAILEDIAADALDWNLHKERVSIDLAEAEDFGAGYESHEDVMFWWGLGGYAASQVITGTFQFVEDYDMWGGWLWSDIAFLRFLVGSPLLETVTGFFDELSRGAALEAMSTYTYRTPYYQMSGAQDYKKGYWGGQCYIWQATIDSDAFVFTSYPGGLEGDYMAGEWTGGWLPRATMYENVGVMQYARRSIPILDDLLFVEYTHAYFPKYAFDEIVESGNWTIGKKGASYVALYSDNPVYWAEEEPADGYELIADGIGNTWIVELGCEADDGTFEQFVTAIENAQITIDETNGVSYNSPSQGMVQVAWDGPMTVAGEPVDTGPYERWDNAYSYQEFGKRRTLIEFDSQRLDLNFRTPGRRYWEEYP